jgi:acetylornithine deacetylase/succinyl-diaminopimelate desuccinylase-like protein
MDANSVTAAISEYLDKHGWETLRDFVSLLQIPNVTGSVDDLRANAAEIAKRFQMRGAIMDVIEIPGASPIVIGELRIADPTATLGVYVHYDGQPIDEEDWTFPPFSPRVCQGRFMMEGSRSPTRARR